MKLTIHSIGCAIGCTLPVIYFEANPILIPVNLAVLVIACLTFDWMVHDK